MGETVASALASERRLAAAAFAPLNTKRRLNEGIEGGAFATGPLAIVHGWFALSAGLSGDLEASAGHTALTAVAILCYYAVLKGRAVWPSIFVLGWLLTEVSAGRWLFGYAAGGSILNWIAVPLGILGVRAAWRRRTSVLSGG